MAADVSESRLHVGKRLAEALGDLSDAELASLAATYDGITPATYTVTAWTADRALAGTETTAADIAAVLATVIKDLQDAGLLAGTTAAP
jgi:methionine synthase II (cobalamin-independent)